MDILSELTDLKTQFAAATALIDEANAAATLAKEALAAKDTAFAALEAEKAQAVADAATALAAKQSELDAKIAELADLQKAADALKAEAKTAEERAIEIAASQGIKAPKVDVEGSGAGMTQSEARAAYAAITDSVERGLFYVKNRDLLLG